MVGSIFFLQDGRGDHGVSESSFGVFGWWKSRNEWDGIGDLVEKCDKKFAFSAENVYFCAVVKTI